MDKEMSEKDAAELLKTYPLPWTHAALGEAKYNELSVKLGYFSGAQMIGKPDLSPPDKVLELARKTAK
jgi:hypothetical protein